MHNSAFDRPLLLMFESLDHYARAHHNSYGSTIGEAGGALAEHWIDAVRALNGLLNGDTGSLDCNIFNRSLRDLAERNGFMRDFGDRA